MTILTKKKTIQGNSEVTPPESTTSHNGNSQINDHSNDEPLTSFNRPTREEKRHLPDYDNFLESGASKRKHRKTTRSSKIHEEEGVSTSGEGEVSGSGYNSGDEYDTSRLGHISEAEWIEKDKSFEKKMRTRGLTVKLMSEDGACMFRAVADQVYGDQEMHGTVRHQCMDYIVANKDYFSQYVTEDFTQYVNRKRLEYTHGNHIEMQAMSEMYNRSIEVFCYGKDPINIFHGVQKTDNEPIRLSYHRGSHYNSIVDPHKATVGVGLGLPNLNPGSADKKLIQEALLQSEDLQIEQTMLEDKLRATDWEATNEAIEEQVARESYLQWLRESSAQTRSLTTFEGQSSTRTRRPSPKHCAESTSMLSSAQSSPRTRHASPKHSDECSECPSTLSVDMSEWSDAGILAQVLAASQQEYLDNLKKAQEKNNSSTVGSSFGEPSTSNQHICTG